jgi:hypothetical protein
VQFVPLKDIEDNPELIVARLLQVAAEDDGEDDDKRVSA